MAYYDYQVRNMGLIVHPENWKKVKEAESLVMNGLPVPRGHLYVAMPELFTYTAEDILLVEQDKVNDNRVALGYVSSPDAGRSPRLLQPGRRRAESESGRPAWGDQSCDATTASATSSCRSWL